MIKKLYSILLFFILSITAVRAQRYADYELISTKLGTSLTNQAPILPNQKIFMDGKTPYYIQWTVVNHGPDTLLNKDTIYLKSGYGVVYKIYNGLPTSLDTFGVSPAPSPQVFPIPAGINPPLIVTAPWCDSLWINAGSGNTPVIDPDMSNNYFCTSVQINYAWAVGINTINSEKDGFLLYPNPANDKLNVRFDFTNAKDIYILLRNTIGQVVHTHRGRLLRHIDA
ncbi:hypothetical protein [Polluticoccus soli]|uniref:hypothetical protein n=1 Tax=Polluticoccus soli TaxID=3034150 RepID=UPI0023E2AA3F|nr:hypothetical protein [Flavipsychrobacter sp. JY13-12]